MGPPRRVSASGGEAYRVGNVRLRICSPEEIKILLDGALIDLRLPARLTLKSLLRLSEAMAFRRDDIGAGRDLGCSEQERPVTASAADV